MERRFWASLLAGTLTCFPSLKYSSMSLPMSMTLFCLSSQTTWMSCPLSKYDRYYCSSLDFIELRAFKEFSIQSKVVQFTLSTSLHHCGIKYSLDSYRFLAFTDVDCTVSALFQLTLEWLFGVLCYFDFWNALNWRVVLLSARVDSKLHRRWGRPTISFWWVVVLLNYCFQVHNVKQLLLDAISKSTQWQSIHLFSNLVFSSCSKSPNFN